MSVRKFEFYWRLWFTHKELGACSLDRSNDDHNGICGRMHAYVSELANLIGGNGFGREKLERVREVGVAARQVS